MTLSRNDKIIAALAVIILIVAAIAVVLYKPAETKTTESSMMTTFTVTWAKQTGEKSLTDLFAGKKSPYNGNFSIDVSEGSVLTSATVQITWQDDHLYGLRKNKGQDTLTVEINLAGGEAKTDTSTGGGNNTLPSFSIYSIPTIDSVDANDSSMAQDIITGMLISKNTASFDVKASIQIGEKIFRPLKYLSDKGNDFNLKISYEYYTPTIGEPSGDSNATTGTTVNENIAHLGMLVATGSGVRY